MSHDCVKSIFSRDNMSMTCVFDVIQLADQFCNAIGVLQQCAPPASFSNIQTAINKDQPSNPTEGKDMSDIRSKWDTIGACLPLD